MKNSTKNIETILGLIIIFTAFVLTESIVGALLALCFLMYFDLRTKKDE